MTIERKKDAKEIEAFITDQQTQPWLGEARKWWPNYLFRVDDITATAKILTSGHLLSRNRALASGVMTVDTACPDVIAQTPEKWKDYVRLYFRPRTPTQYANEGFRPVDKRVLGGAHCPVPIALLFDSTEILTRSNTLFSDGNLAANAEVGGDVKFLSSIPFKKVYHDRWFDPSERNNIVYHRHAEVIVPNELDMSALRHIGCRSQAEYETLLYLIGHHKLRKYKGIISVGSGLNLHNQRWTFVENVELSHNQARFLFNPSSRTPGPFHARIDITKHPTGEETYWENNSYLANEKLKLNIRKSEKFKKYDITLKLDDQIAYANRYSKEQASF